MPNEELGSSPRGAQHLLSSFVHSFCRGGSILPASSLNGTPSFPAFSVPFLSVSIPSYSCVCSQSVQACLILLRFADVCFYKLRQDHYLQKAYDSLYCKTCIIAKPTIISEVCLYLKVLKFSLSLIPGLQIPSSLHFYFSIHLYLDFFKDLCVLAERKLGTKVLFNTCRKQQNGNSKSFPINKGLNSPIKRRIEGMDFKNSIKKKLSTTHQTCFP